MSGEILLNGTWELRDELLSWSVAEAPLVARRAEGWIPTPVPGDIHQGLIDAGRIAEPLLGLNSFACRWTEDRSWWYRRSFEATPELLDAEAVELELNGLDSNAEIFLNGVHLGSHRNTFRPFVAEVKALLQAGENSLLVRLSAGVEQFGEADYDAPDGVRAVTEAGNGRPERGDPRRVLVRKPQFSFGWDWSPRVATTAISGDVKLRALRKACIRDVSLRPKREGEAVSVCGTVTVDGIHYYRTCDAVVALALTDAQGRRVEAEKRILIRSGMNHIDLMLHIDDPQLWWPNGMGSQHPYRVEASLCVENETQEYPPFNWGLRFVELDTAGTFAVVVNGCKIFCKGANWIPTDAIYARIDDPRYDRLVREARDANFNMLRIWGGGLYEREAFYEACDRYGILLWHDFMFACAPYPDHLESFRIEVEREADFQTKRLRRHACMALWSGNNENQWGFNEWWNEKTRGGSYVYNYILPDAVRRNCPEIPYWNGSPYGGLAPNCHEVGDRHHWGDCTMSAYMECRITPERYDACSSLFISEFGYIGAPSRETIAAYLDGAPFDRRGAVWQHHNNTFEKDTVEAGIRKHYIDPEGLTLDDYLLYSGLCQGLMYAYSLESMRARPECHGGLFWMFEDCWGEVGWTVIDYYLRRKISYWFARRAFEPVRLILRSSADQAGIRVIAANDLMEPVDVELEFGYVTLDGRESDLQSKRITCPPLQRTEAVVFPFGDHDRTHGIWIARARNRSDMAPGILRAIDFRTLEIADPGLTYSIEGNSVHVATQGYAHAVCLSLPEGCTPSDNYFELLPGETREIRIDGVKELGSEQVKVSCVNGSARPQIAPTTSSR